MADRLTGMGSRIDTKMAVFKTSEEIASLISSKNREALEG